MSFSGGESGIRTHGALTGSPDFKSGAFDHSAISPLPAYQKNAAETLVDSANSGILGLRICHSFFMNKISSSFAITLCILSLSACDWFAGNTDGESTSSSSASSAIQETRNVLYRGTLREAGVSIFMQGTHRLELDDGRFVLLESEIVDLDDYMDMRVEVYGSVRPTVEAGGMIMRVESVASLEVSSSSSIDSSSADSSSSESSEASQESLSSSRSSAVSVTVSSKVSSVAVSSTSSIEVVSSASSADSGASGDIQAKAAVMAKENMAASNWTQQYCSSHIKFCIPVHKNWWYTSFGATASSLWHMEIGPEELESIGDGVITVKLVSGSVSSEKQVTVSGGFATGYRSWDANRHFEITAPANLEQAVRYITEQLSQTAG